MITGGSAGNSASGTSGATASGSQTISAEQLHSLANSGRADSITKLFPSGEDESAKTFFLNLSPEDFGVPAGGYMVLAIESDGFLPSYGSRWENTQLASEEDGQLHFTDIPMVRVGSHVTVTVLCYTADGMLISSGYSSGVATENGVPMQIGIIGSAVIAFGPNGTESGNTTEHDGMLYDIIGYSGTSLDMAAVNTNSGSTMEVKINGTTVGTTTDQSFTKTLADGYNAIEVTVTKGSNEPIVVTRNVYVVKEFAAPVITLGSNGVANGLTVTSGGKSYEVLEYTGTNMVMTVTNSYTGTATFGVTVNDSPLSVSTSSVTATLADGPNAIVATLTENVCGTVTAEKYVYVVKKLVKPTITQFGGTLGSGTVTGTDGKSYQILEYTGSVPTVTAAHSYEDAANASFMVNGSPVSGSATSVSVTLSDGCNTIVAALSRDHCVTQTETKYFYVTKPLVAPVITRGGSGETNGKTATGTDGMTYDVIEYDGEGTELPNITAENSYDGTGAEFTVKINGNTKSGTPASVSSDLADGFNKVVASLSNAETGVSLNDTKYFYVIKKLTKPDVEYTDGMLTDEAADAGGYHPLRYSYLGAPDPVAKPKFSVTNPYSDGSVTMTVSVDSGTPLVGAATTGNITNQALTDGTHTITITLSHPYCTDLVVNKKIKVAIKPVKVSVTSIDWWFCSHGDGQACANQTFYIKAVNADGEDAGQKTCYTVSSQYGQDLGGSNSKLVLTPNSSSNYVYLTDPYSTPASTFKFYTSRSSITGMSYELSMICEGDSNTTKTLVDLKAIGAAGSTTGSTNLATGDMTWDGNPSPGAGAHGNYTITISWAEKDDYTEATAADADE